MERTGPYNPLSSILPELYGHLHALKGVKWCEAEAGLKKWERLPISPDLLRKIKSVWEQDVENPDKVMLWAACCLRFFCFLRAGEMTVLSDQGFDPAVYLTRMDIAVDSQVAPCTLRVQLKQSKSDHLGRESSCLWERPSRMSAL